MIQVFEQQLAVNMKQAAEFIELQHVLVLASHAFLSFSH